MCERLSLLGGLPLQPLKSNLLVAVSKLNTNTPELFLKYVIYYDAYPDVLQLDN